MTVQQIKLLVPLFLGETTFEEGAILELDMEWARRIVALGQAEYVVPDPRQAQSSPIEPPEKAVAHGHDPHQQPMQSATAMPPTERAATRTGVPDPKHHPKK